jgi:chromosome segregation ATPase
VKTEQHLEAKITELEQAKLDIVALQTSITNSQEQLEHFKADLRNTTQSEIKNKDLEFKKLLAENTNLISEIDEAQDKIEALEAEVALLKSELEEVKLHSAGKAADFKETLANKNFEITNLEANNAALNQELLLVKQELTVLQNQLQEVSASGSDLAELQATIADLTAEKNSLISEITGLQSSILSLNGTVSELNESINSLNTKISSYETEITNLKSLDKSDEQEAFIDRLFKQIDGLNDERLLLLDEKEQMANQLLKMNDVIGSISQQVDSESIDVTSLNNHRKNVILATNSGGTSEKSQMKEQINDLVREIDKCIALLSA